jgi:hypothetical protein
MKPTDQTIWMIPNFSLLGPIFRYHPNMNPNILDRVIRATSKCTCTPNNRLIDLQLNAHLLARI